LKRSFLLALVAFSISAHAGVITFVNSRVGLGANDLVTWGLASDDGQSVSSPYARVSTGGVTATATLTGGFTIFENDGVNASLSSNFASGDIVLDSAMSDGPITITFSSAVTAVGFQIQHLALGAFNGFLSVYGAGNILMGTVNAGGTTGFDNDGSALFLGARSDLRDIMSIQISVDQVSGTSALSINQMSLDTLNPSTGIPEPSTFALVAGALAAFSFYRRK
jgi:hypothetical protein